MIDPMFDDERSDKSDDGLTEEPSAGLPRATVIAAALSIVLIVASTFLGIKRSAVVGQLETVTAELTELDSQRQTLETQLAGLEVELSRTDSQLSLIENGKLTICNRAERPLTVIALSSAWVADDGTYTSFSSETYGRRLWTIPGQTDRTLELGGGSIYDGSTVFYSLWVEYLGDQYFLMGTWQDDAEEGCYVWSGR